MAIDIKQYRSEPCGTTGIDRTVELSLSVGEVGHNNMRGCDVEYFSLNHFFGQKLSSCR